MLRSDGQMKLSEYRSLYDVIIPTDNLLRKIKDNIDFSFVNPILKKAIVSILGGLQKNLK